MKRRRISSAKNLVYMNTVVIVSRPPCVLAPPKAKAGLCHRCWNAEPLSETPAASGQHPALRPSAPRWLPSHALSPRHGRLRAVVAVSRMRLIRQVLMSDVGIISSLTPPIPALRFAPPPRFRGISQLSQGEMESAVAGTMETFRSTVKTALERAKATAGEVGARRVFACLPVATVLIV